MNITVIGTGFVGVVSAAVYSSLGHQVIGLDINEKTIKSLQQNKVPFYEPELETLLKEQQQAGKLTFTTSYKKAISKAEVIVIAVGTPSALDGQADLKYVFATSESLARYIKPKVIVAIKSTVPPGTLDKVTNIIKAKTKVSFYTASLPEFLKEGSAVQDTLHPDRVVIGATHQQAFSRLEELHAPLKAPIVKISPESAQMSKYSANAFLATRITFINQIADLCERNGADVQEVVEAIGYDKRIGQHYWYPGFGYGGSCFPKDVSELAAYSRAVGETDNLFNKVHSLNQNRINRMMQKFEKRVGGWSEKKVALLGLSFKPQTDDVREAPCLKIAPLLLQAGATVRGFDPKAKITQSMINVSNALSKNFIQAENIESATKDADVVFALIEWPEIIAFDYSRIRNAKKKQWFIDARNQLEPGKVKRWGFQYIGIGRS